MRPTSVRQPMDLSLRPGVGDLQRAPSPSTVSVATRVRRRPDACGALLRLVISLQSRENRTELIIRVTGDLDLMTAPTLSEALDRARRDASQNLGATAMVVDLRSVRFLSAAGIHALADAHDACTGAGMRLRVVADQPAVTRPLMLTGLDRLLDLRATLTP